MTTHLPKPDAAAPLNQVFATYLPGRLLPHTLPEAIAHGELMFVAQGDVPLAWQLHGNALAQGGHFLPCAADAPAKCRIMMSQDDFLALARGQLNLQMAFMQGRLKVVGDIACAMELGALFG